MKVYNRGTGELSVNSISSDNALFTPSANAVAVAPNDSAILSFVSDN